MTCLLDILKSLIVCCCVISYFLTHPVACKRSNCTNKWWEGNKRQLQCAIKELVCTGNSVTPDVTGTESELIVEGGVDFLLLNCTYLQSCWKWFYVYSAGQVLRFLYSMLFIAVPFVEMIWLLIHRWILNEEFNHESDLFFCLPVIQAIFIFNFTFLLQYRTKINYEWKEVEVVPLEQLSCINA